MSADLLRETAALMRSRAKAASAGPYVAAEQTHGEWYGLQTPYFAIGNIFAQEDAAHIASWHPDVALAVADWLDIVAASLDREKCWGFTTARPGSPAAAAIAVARAYMGATS